MVAPPKPRPGDLGLRLSASLRRLLPSDRRVRVHQSATRKVMLAATTRFPSQAWVNAAASQTRPPWVRDATVLDLTATATGAAFDALAHATGIRIGPHGGARAGHELDLRTLSRLASSRVPRPHPGARRQALSTRRRRVRPLLQRRTPSPRALPADPGARGAPCQGEDRHVAGTCGLHYAVSKGCMTAAPSLRRRRIGEIKPARPLGRGEDRLWHQDRRYSGGADH